ncbi:MAG: hypothetical protein VKS61_02900 [Candidatus Sericytochromatia bacterium]|nr:hypothetical protein [Candidatus Sericytochromatia bacterium]
MQPGKQARVLVLWDAVRHTAATVSAHVEALRAHSSHDVQVLSLFGSLPDALALDRFDAVVIHYSLNLCVEGYLCERSRARLAAFKGVKAVFIQDEYRLVDRTIAALQAIGCDLLFTCVPEEEWEKVYPTARLPRMAKVNVLTGYVDEALLGRKVPPLDQRPIDIGYRARKVPAWLGDLGQEKYNIGVRVAEDARPHGLKVDLAYREEERLYGEAWIAFMTRCKATLGVESGASVFDFTGEIQAAVDQAVAADPGLPYEELKRRHFAQAEGLIRLNQISPRCFEAAALRTLMVLYEGEYSGRLEPWRHYVPLKKDHSNFGEVVTVLRDPARAAAIVQQAYDEVACAPRNSFRAAAAEFDEAVAAALRAKGEPPVANPYGPPEMAAVQAAADQANRRRLRQREVFTGLYFFLFGRLLGFLPEPTRDKLARQLHHALQPLVRVAQRVFRRLRGR